uniref:Uncharacterized protein n=1 Tax=Picea sitchensis TaxID=3332 RepID=D5AB88_PICSI|nr:unknown [Picea sitchensis]
MSLAIQNQILSHVGGPTPEPSRILCPPNSDQRRRRTKRCGWKDRQGR